MDQLDPAHPLITMRLRVAVLVVGVWLFTTACTDQAVPLPPGVGVAEGFELQVAATDFDRPTQLSRTPDGDIVVGELAGGERDATGRVTLIDGTDFDQRTVLFRDLDKPTGVAVIGDRIWIMQRDSLWSGHFAGSETDASGLGPVLVDLPSNGRSEGTLTVTPDGGLLFDTSGSRRGPRVTEGSGTLFVIDSPTASPSQERPVATGFKHAYAHVFAPDGQLFSVEMTDGNFDGTRASDELVVVTEGGDAGWPLCVDDDRPVIELGGTDDDCDRAFRSHALFDPGATPTSIVVAPWDPDTLLVTLWIPGLVVAVPTAAAATPHRGEIIVSGIESPQALLVDGDRVLIADHETGTLFSLTG